MRIMVWFYMVVSKFEKGKNSTHHSVCLSIRLLDALGFVKRILADNLNPISIWIQRKGNVPHATICQLFLELVPGILESLARSLNVVNAHAGMSETFSGLRVSCRNLIFGIVLGAVVMCQFDETFAIAPVVAVGCSFGRIVAHKVKVEFGFWLFNLSNHLHAEEFIEFDCRITH